MKNLLQRIQFPIFDKLYDSIEAGYFKTRPESTIYTNIQELIKRQLLWKTSIDCYFIQWLRMSGFILHEDPDVEIFIIMIMIIITLLTCQVK